VTTARTKQRRRSGKPRSTFPQAGASRPRSTPRPPQSRIRQRAPAAARDPSLRPRGVRSDARVGDVPKTRHPCSATTQRYGERPRRSFFPSDGVPLSPSPHAQGRRTGCNRVADGPRLSALRGAVEAQAPLRTPMRCEERRGGKPGEEHRGKQEPERMVGEARGVGRGHRAPRGWVLSFYARRGPPT